MNIFVISDTHGQIDRAVEMYERFSAGVIIDAVIHCGDYKRDADLLARKLHQKVVSVRGNCDGALEREFQTLDTPAGRILVTHGHTENVGWGPDRLALLAESEGCACACYGHTHVPLVRRLPARAAGQDSEGRGDHSALPSSPVRSSQPGNSGAPGEPGELLLINPGSLTRPRDGTDGSCALLIAAEKGFTASIIYYGNGPAPAQKKKARGGRLRSILNYSDGQ